MLGTLTDLVRSKSELVAENALLRRQLIILRRQVKQPACTKTDRMLLVCWLLRISVLKNASPMARSDPLPLHLYIGQMAIELLTLLFTALF
jgi:putative transposase